MPPREEDIEALAATGLTRTEAKVYLTCISFEKATARAIWKNSGVSRQDIYRVLAELQRKGLIEKIIAAPTEYRALPLKDGLRVLLKRKAQEYSMAEEKIKELLDRFETDSEKKTASNEPEFIWTERGDASGHRVHRLFENAQTRIDLIDHWSSFQRGFTRCAELFMEISRRGVKLRFLIEKPEDPKLMPKQIQTLKKKGILQIRFTDTHPPNTITLADGKEVFFTTISTDDAAESPNLWSNNPCLLTILQEYFELKWNNAIEDTT